MKNKKQGRYKYNKNAPLSKKQRKRLEKRGIVIKEKSVRGKKGAERVRMPREKKLFIALVAALSVLAIVCTTFGGILIAKTVLTVPYGTAYDTLRMSKYLSVKQMGKTFYTGNTFDFSEIEKLYAPKDAAYMDEYIEQLRLAHREEIALGQKTTAIGFADDVALYVTDIFRGESPADEAAEKANRIPASTMPMGNTYVSSFTFTVGTEFFGKDFDDKLIAMALKPVDTGREVRYNGTVTALDTVCLTYSVYQSAGKVTEGVTDGTPLVDRYTWKTSPMSASVSKMRVDLTADLEATLTAALVENCAAVGEPFTFVLENYSLSGDGSNVSAYKFEAQIHFVVEKEVTKDITFTFPADFFNEGDGATLMALNGKTVTFRVIVAAMEDYELPTFNREFITEKLGIELDETDEAAALAEYKAEELVRINERLARDKHAAQVEGAYQHLADKAVGSGLFVSNFDQVLAGPVQNRLYYDLHTLFISRCGYMPSTAELDAFAASYYLETGGQIQISGRDQYLQYKTQDEIKLELIMYYVFRDRGFEITDEMLEQAYAAQIAELIEDMGDPETYNEEYFVNYYTKDALYQQVRRDLVYQMVGEYLLENNSSKLW